MRGFGELEQAIMDALWDAGEPLAVRGIIERLGPERDPAYTTVQTVTEILHRKGWLTRAKEGRSFRYRPMRSREEYAASLIDQVWATGADRTATLVRLVDELDPSEVAELRAALARRTAEAQPDAGRASVAGSGSGSGPTPDAGPATGNGHGSPPSDTGQADPAPDAGPASGPTPDAGHPTGGGPGNGPRNGIGAPGVTGTPDRTPRR